MELRNALTAVSPYHIVRDGFQEEAKIKAAYGQPDAVLPFELGLKGGLEIHRVRMRTLGKITALSAGVLVATPLALQAAEHIF